MIWPRVMRRESATRAFKRGGRHVAIRLAGFATAFFWRASPSAALQARPMAAANRTQSERRDPVIQFSIFTANKVGRLNELVALLGSHNVHVMALNTLETTDSAILRVVVDDPDRARDLFNEHRFPFNECELLAVELAGEADLRRVLTALLEAEINIHYIYPFIFRPLERAALAINADDVELAGQALHMHGFRVLGQKDIAR